MLLSCISHSFKALKKYHAGVELAPLASEASVPQPELMVLFAFAVRAFAVIAFYRFFPE